MFFFFLSVGQKETTTTNKQTNKKQLQKNLIPRQDSNSGIFAEHLSRPGSD